MTNLIWLVIALPLAGALFNGIFGRRVGYQVVAKVAPTMVFLAFLIGLGGAFETYARHGKAQLVTLWTWAEIGELNIPISFLVDPLSMTMVLVITGVGFLIHIYATDYMVHHHHGETHPDRDFARFFTFLNLFIASMLVLVLGDNYLMMFIGWELVGACSYLLIGFWHDRGDDPQPAIEIEGGEAVQVAPLLSPAASGMKAFVVNRIGDVGFALGVFLIWTTFGTLQFDQLFSRIASSAEMYRESALHGEFTVISMIALLLFIGAMGKSAQIPLYVWLPDAMAGPTPVSALIHAATMVTAGIYMIVRSNIIYTSAPNVSFLVAMVGALTAFFAATIALVQVDLKRVLAYSTVSQLGYMFMAVGVGAYTAGMFHLVTHAFFKACLFLGAGSVMHALGDVIDIRRMGGLRKKMPHTAMTFYLGGLALAGFPLTAGFFSKDEILAKTFEYSPMLWGIGIVTAGMTAFYTFRAIFLAFEGEPRDQELYDHAHENRLAVTAPLWILAVLAIFGGLLGLPAPLLHGVGIDIPHAMENWLHPVIQQVGHHEVHHLPFITELALFLISGFLGVASIGLAYYFYIVDRSIPQNLARSTHPIFALLVNKYYIDELYNTVFVKPALTLSNTMSRGIDQTLIDGIVDGSAYGIAELGKYLSQLQNGFISRYALATFIGVLFLVGYFFLGGQFPNWIY
ncbi:NADH-quinone oxidoreductase subunit L [Anaerolineales bacterium HSG25]|nr:NADH-quinone oxidoreductase subunit L [Anaerolineales bacterium HSG25]